jgi:hypothetical protein
MFKSVVVLGTIDFYETHGKPLAKHLRASRPWDAALDAETLQSLPGPRECNIEYLARSPLVLPLYATDTTVEYIIIEDDTPASLQEEDADKKPCTAREMACSFQEMSRNNPHAAKVVVVTANPDHYRNINIDTASKEKLQNFKDTAIVTAAPDPGDYPLEDIRSKYVNVEHLKYAAPAADPT